MLTGHAILLVVDLVAPSVPSQTLGVLFLAEDQRFEAIAEERLILDKIADVESHFLVLAGAGGLEAEPLVVPFGVDVVLEDEVVGLYAVCPFAISIGPHQVPIFEVRLEHQTCS